MYMYVTNILENWNTVCLLLSFIENFSLTFIFLWLNRYCDSALLHVCCCCCLWIYRFLFLFFFFTLLSKTESRIFIENVLNCSLSRTQLCWFYLPVHKKINKNTAGCQIELDYVYMRVKDRANYSLRSQVWENRKKRKKLIGSLLANWDLYSL